MCDVTTLLYKEWSLKYTIAVVICLWLTTAPLEGTGMGKVTLGYATLYIYFKIKMPIFYQHLLPCHLIPSLSDQSLIHFGINQAIPSLADSIYLVNKAHNILCSSS